MPPLSPETAVPSPCISVCRMDAPSGLCVGCWRTINEIASWAALSDEAKREVWHLIEQRQAALPAFALSSSTSPAP